MKNKKEGVEELGVVFDRFGKPPMENRVFATLLLSEPPYLPFQEIVDFLGASKSAVSNALSALQREGAVGYRTFSGDRKRYFEVSIEGWRKNIEERAIQLGSINNALKRVVEYREENGFQGLNKDLEKILEFQIYLTQKIEKAILDWEFE